jgi:hypothetical protein
VKKWDGLFLKKDDKTELRYIERRYIGRIFIGRIYTKRTLAPVLYLSFLLRVRPILMVILRLG